MVDYYDPYPVGVTPEPCYGCWIVSYKLMVCVGLCEGLTDENLEVRRAHYAREFRVSQKGNDYEGKHKKSD